MEQKEHFHIYVIMLPEESEGIKNTEILESSHIFCDLKKNYRSTSLDSIFFSRKYFGLDLSSLQAEMRRFYLV